VERLRRVLPIYLAQPEIREAVVVVDGSRDNTLSYLAELAKIEPRLRYIDNAVNRGIPYSKNVGMAVATSEYVFFGEDDLEITDGFFSILLAHLKASGADAIAGRTIWRDLGESAEDAVARADREVGPAVDTKRIVLNQNVRLDDDAQQLLVSSPTLVKRELCRKYPFDERYVSNGWREESDFQLTLQEHGLAVFSCPHAVCYNLTTDERSGAHKIVGLRRVSRILWNNWRFLGKHKAFIAEHFQAGNRVVSTMHLAAVLIKKDVVVPHLERTKRLLS
jgi:glycosyltransferase involved in cell wall biosynthesis